LIKFWSKLLTYFAVLFQYFREVYAQRAVFLGVNRPRREAHYSSPSRAEVKNKWSYTSILQTHLHSLVLN